MNINKTFRIFHLRIKSNTKYCHSIRKICESSFLSVSELCLQYSDPANESIPITVSNRIGNDVYPFLVSGLSPSEISRFARSMSNPPPANPKITLLG